MGVPTSLGKLDPRRRCNDARVTGAWHTREFSYAEVGGTRADTLPVGYRWVRRRQALGVGRPAFERAAAALIGWQMHRGAGLCVVASTPTAQPGAVVAMRLGLGPIGIPMACRVVYVVEESQRAGFAYGTLTGHPESGEESFVVDLDDSGAVHLTIRAFSRPANWLVRAGGPIPRAVQLLITEQYVRTLRAISAG